MHKLKYVLIVVLLIGVGVLGTTAWYTLTEQPASDSPAGTALEDSSSTNPSDNSSSDQTIEEVADSDSGDIPYVDLEIGTKLSTQELVQEVGPAVVSITTETMAQGWYFQPVPEEGAGTGIIVSADGYIVTNYHVIEGADTITVTLSDGKTYEATVEGSDSETDLAVVDIEATNLSYLHFLDNALEQLNPLDTVVAVGNALALSGGPTWTTGVVSNLGRSIEESDGTVLYDLIQTDAAINEGNSGGPLVNMAGQVVGINTAIASDAENIGFAISTDTAIPVVESLIEEGKVTRPWLGVSVITVTTSIQRNYSLATDTGVLVARLSSGSPAAVAGLRSGDVIVSIDGQQVDTADELQLEVRSHQVGDTLKITYWRGQEQKETNVTLGQAPS